MNRFLRWVNLVGVLALACLCALQWRENRDLNLQISRHQSVQTEQAARLEGYVRAASGQTNDLAILHKHLDRLAADLKNATERLSNAEHELRQIAGERDQLKLNITNWAGAVTARDERLKQAGDQVGNLVRERNEAVTRFNELVGRYNRLAEDYQRLRQSVSTVSSNVPAPERR